MEPFLILLMLQFGPVSVTLCHQNIQSIFPACIIRFIFHSLYLGDKDSFLCWICNETASCTVAGRNVTHWRFISKRIDFIISLVWFQSYKKWTTFSSGSIALNSNKSLKKISILNTWALNFSLFFYNDSSTYEMNSLENQKRIEWKYYTSHLKFVQLGEIVGFEHEHFFAFNSNNKWFMIKWMYYFQSEHINFNLRSRNRNEFVYNKMLMIAYLQLFLHSCCTRAHM